MTQINSQIIILFSSSIITIFVLGFFLKRFRNRELNDKEIAGAITNLYDAVIRLDKNKAFKSFVKLSPYFDKGESAMYYSKNFNNGIFVVMGFDLVKIYWENLRSEFLDMLEKYKLFNNKVLADAAIESMIKTLEKHLVE